MHAVLSTFTNIYLNLKDFVVKFLRKLYLILQIIYNLVTLFLNETNLINYEFLHIFCSTFVREFEVLHQKQGTTNKPQMHRVNWMLDGKLD